MSFTPAFWKWFKDSAVVDRDGQPLVVYHGTRRKFNEFKRTSDSDFGFHFGSIDQAESRLERTRKLAGGGPEYIMPVYLSIQNPLKTADPGDWHNAYNAWMTLNKATKGALGDEFEFEHMLKWKPERRLDHLTGQLEFLGYDGVVYRNRHEGRGESWIALRPSQIKSVENDGSFGADDPNIKSNPGIPNQRGWVSPQGELIQFKGTHGEVAKEILEEKFPSVKWQKDKLFWRASDFRTDPNLALEHKGWVRVVRPGVYEVWSALTYAKRLPRNLIDLLSELPEDHEVLIDAVQGRGFDGWKAKDLLEKFS